MIDAVITYVDASDKTWIAQYNKFVKAPLEEKINRYRSYNVLDLQIKCIRKFMPFVSKIFIIVSSVSQVKEDIKNLDNVIVIEHKEIIPQIYLPCFNSCTIEMFFSKINKLSEKFLYFNDDVFPIKECKEEDFFVDDDICMNFELNKYDEEIASIFQHNIINSTKLFYKKNTKFNAIKPMHSIMPMFKSKCKTVFDEHNKEIMNSLTRTRHRKNLNAYMFLNYIYNIGNHLDSKLKYEYIELDDGFSSIKKDTQILCVNDNNIYSNFEQNCKELRKYFESVINKTKYKKILKKEKIIPFSICISAYKAKDFIKECLDSIQVQTYFKNNNDYEILLGIDGCQETLEYIKTIQHDYRNLKVYMMDCNKGTYITSNTLMGSIAKYDWLIRFDADDIMNDNLVEEIAKSINHNNFDICRFCYYNFDNKTKHLEKKLYKAFGCLCINANKFKVVGGYRPWKCGADTELLRRVEKYFNVFVISDKCLFRRRKHENELTAQKETNMTSPLRLAYKEFIANEKINSFDDMIINLETNTYKEIY